MGGAGAPSYAPRPEQIGAFEKPASGGRLALSPARWLFAGDRVSPAAGASGLFRLYQVAMVFLHRSQSRLVFHLVKHTTPWLDRASHRSATSLKPPLAWTLCALVHIIPQEKSPFKNRAPQGPSQRRAGSPGESQGLFYQPSSWTCPRSFFFWLRRFLRCNRCSRAAAVGRVRLRRLRRFRACCIRA